MNEIKSLLKYLNKIKIKCLNIEKIYEPFIFKNMLGNQNVSQSVPQNVDNILNLFVVNIFIQQFTSNHIHM
jgi:hypothetical protein